LSAVKVGFTAVALDNAAELPAGIDVNDQVYVSVSPSASVLPLASSVTSDPVDIFWSGPAFAVGAVFPPPEFPPPPLPPQLAMNADNAKAATTANVNMLNLFIMGSLFLSSEH
jgi:hypothetical protein